MKPTQAQIEAAAKALRELDQQQCLDWSVFAEAALTAAAEVGEQWKPDIHGTKSEIWGTAVAATIERCAQVAKWFSNVEKFTAEDVAARILALKDKP